jgi:hypothetical protein
MSAEDAKRTSDDWLSAATRPWLYERVNSRRINEVLRDARCTLPPSLSREWGEASWTARDLWVNRPAYAAARAAGALSTRIPTLDVDAVQRTYRRLRQARVLRANEAPNPTTAMLALSARVASWTATLVIVAVALIVVLLGVQLGIVDALVK